MNFNDNIVENLNSVPEIQKPFIRFRLSVGGC